MSLVLPFLTSICGPYWRFGWRTFEVTEDGQPASHLLFGEQMGLEESLYLQISEFASG